MRIVLLCLALLLPLRLGAETVHVRSADVGEVTRVVLQFETLPDWRAERTPEGYAIILPNDLDVKFVQDALFSAVGGGRIADILDAQKGGRLDIRLACDCWARVYVDGETTLVVDLENGPAPLDTPFQSLLVAASPVAEFKPVTLGSPNPEPALIWRSSSIVPSERWDPPPIRSTELPPAPVPDGLVLLENSFALPDLTSSGLVDELAGLSPLDQGNSFAVDMISRELSRAVAQGLVDAPDLSSKFPRLSSNSPGTTALGDGRSNIAITTAVDRDTGTSAERLDPTFLGSVCLPDIEVDLVSWGDPKDSQQLGTLRRQAFNSDGTASQAGVLDLARYYLVMGFGAEATEIASLLENQVRRDLIQTLAEIIDDGESDSEFLDGQVSCKGKVALWAMLAKDVPSSEKPANTNHILSTFSELPEHIRIHLGPVLSTRLQDLQFEAEAQIALNAVTRGGGHTRAQDLTAARLGLSGTTADKARTTLVQLSRGTDMIAAEALLELLEDAERRGVPPEGSWVSDAASLVRATQGTETAIELNLASMRGFIALGAFDDLRDALNTWSPGVTEDKRRDLANLAIAEAASMAKSAAFLRAEVAFSKVSDPTRMSLDQRLAVADRLLSLGLSQRSMSYLPTVAEDNRVVRSRARALAALNQYGEAISLLSGFDSSEMLSDLGDVLLKDRKIAAAVQAFERSNETEAASLAAMQGGDWAWISENATPELSEASQALLDGQSVADGETVADNAALLSRAAERKKRAMQLLDLTAVPGTPSFTN